MRAICFGSTENYIKYAHSYLPYLLNVLFINGVLFSEKMNRNEMHEFITLLLLVLIDHF